VRRGPKVLTEPKGGSGVSAAGLGSYCSGHRCAELVPVSKASRLPGEQQLRGGTAECQRALAVVADAGMPAGRAFLGQTVE
jgi:hypothetical protein